MYCYCQEFHYQVLLLLYLPTMSCTSIVIGKKNACIGIGKSPLYIPIIIGINIQMLELYRYGYL